MIFCDVFLEITSIRVTQNSAQFRKEANLNYRKTATIPSLGRVSVNFYGAAKVMFDLYERKDEFNRQKKIKQLGLIPEIIEGVSHTRYEYLMMQCSLADILDNLHKGSPSAQGSISIGGKDVLGNSLIKCWVMLSNYGHTKHTYGDEKSLHLFAKKRKGFKSAVLSPIKDSDLKRWCDNTIEKFFYHQFHYVLTAHRIYKDLKRRNVEQSELALYLKLLILDSDTFTGVVNVSKLNQLKELFKKIRDISIVTLDGHFSHVPISIDLLSALVSMDSIEGGVQGQKISSVINPIRNILHENVYLDKNVLAVQRSYEIAALKYLHSIPAKSANYLEALDRSFNDGIGRDNAVKLTHFCRFSITKEMIPDTDFYDEFRNITIRSRVGCKNTQAYLDVNPFTHVRYADFFIGEKFENSQLPSFIFNICQLITSQIQHLVHNHSEFYRPVVLEIRKNATARGLDAETVDKALRQSKDVVYRDAWNSANSLVFPSYRGLLWSCVSYFLKPNYRLEIETRSTTHENYAFSIPTADKSMLTGKIDAAIEAVKATDLDRAHELKAIRSSATRKHDGYKIACLVRVNVCDLSQPPSKRKVTDLDGILLKVSKSEISLELYEAKNRKNASKLAKKDINKGLVPILSSTAKGYRVREIKGIGAKLVITFRA